ncbi:MAG: AAA family ATPase, partial [Roseateles sp.]
VFTRPAKPTALGVQDFQFVDEEVSVLSRLLTEAVARKASGVNVLLYGPPGTGKTELAKVAAAAAGLDLYEVEYADRDGNSLSGRDRYRSLQISQVFLKASENVALLFDEVEDVFPPLSSDTASLLNRMDASAEGGSGNSVSGKAWVNQILETNPVPVIWVTNRIEQIDPAFRRRFQYHLELKSPPPGARQGLVARALGEVAVSESFVAKLAERPGLTPAQIRTAVRFAQLAGGAEDAERLIERQLLNADKALGRSDGATLARPSVTQYTLELLNCESRFEIPRIVEALRRQGRGQLCFYGPPGTGKTALAEHIAQHLGRPLMVKRASDIASKFVGETEQNMARMFETAQTEGAVLLLDEADSFLRSRRHAERNYEVSEVNEMLAGMERFNGLFICTTNLFDELDEAALRRFAFKIRFKPLRPEQRLAMFEREAGAAPDDEQRSRLAALDCLAHGDFAAVRHQVEILGEAFTPDEFLAQLEAEHRAKPEVRERRGIGFRAS